MKTLPITIKAIASELRHRHPELSAAIGEAIDLLTESNGDRWRFMYHDYNGAPVYQMTGRNRNSRYVVAAGLCTCPAFNFRHALCYHRIARRILTLRSENLTAVEWGEAIALEDTTGEGAPVAEVKEHFVEVMETGVPRVLTVRESMDELGRHLENTRIKLLAIKG